MRRMTLNLNQETDGFLRTMKQEHDMTYTATIWRAVSLFKYILKLQDNGGTIIAHDANGTKREIRIML